MEAERRRLRTRGGRGEGRLYTWAVLLCFLLGSVVASADAEDVSSMVERGRSLLAENRIREADEAFSKAARKARKEGRLDTLKDALWGRMRCAAAAHDLIGQRDVGREIRALAGEMKRPAFLALVETNLGHLEAELGNLTVALALLDHALGYFEAHDEPVLRAHVLARTASAQRRRRDYASALDNAEGAARAFRDHGDDRSLVEALTVLGNIHLDLGDPDQALAIYQDAVAHLGEEGSAAHADLEAMMGVVRQEQGHFEEAAKGLTRASETLAALGDLRGAATCLTQLGFTHAQAGRHAEALEAFQRVHTMKSADLMASAYALLYMGGALLELGRKTDAKQQYEKALEHAARIEDPHLESACHGGLARVALLAGDARGALEHIRTSLDLVDEITAGLAPLSTAFGREARSDIFRTAIRAAWRTGSEPLLFEYLERSRAGVLHRGLGGRDALRSTALPADLAEEEETARERVLVANQRYGFACATGKLEPVREAGRKRRAAFLAYDAVLDRIQRRTAGRGQAAFPSYAAIGDVQSSLAEGEALVLYSLLGEQARALVVTKTDRWPVELGPSEVIVGTAADLLALIRGREDASAAARKVAAQLIEPLHLPESTRMLLVSPDGPLAYVPFSLVVEDKPVALVPSSSVYLLLRNAPDAVGKGVLAFGDPVYRSAIGSTATKVYAGGARLERLPETAVEVATITTTLNDVRFLREKATEERLAAAVGTRERWRAVHLACHGLVNNDRPSLSALALTPSPQTDGFLTVIEVFGMHIPTDLAVLSACRTGRGRSLAADGVLGLTQAFLYAGSSRVISSMWKVNDEATCALMGEFYALWNPPDGRRPLGAAEALREAQAYVRDQKEWAHPHYWAAWVLWGLAD